MKCRWAHKAGPKTKQFKSKVPFVNDVQEYISLSYLVPFNTRTTIEELLQSEMRYAYQNHTLIEGKDYSDDKKEV